MAFTPGQKLEGEEEDGQGTGAPAAPSISGPGMGATPSVGGSAVGSSPIAQPNGVGGGAGTGFTNIDRYLGANKGAGAQVKAAGDKALGADQSAFNTANDAVNENVAGQNKPVVDPNTLVTGVVGAGSTAGQTTSAMDAAKKIINNSFQGPGTVNYNVGNTDQMKQAQALGNSASAGTQLAQNNGPLLGYGQSGLNAIDAAIYGSQQEKGAGVDAVASAKAAQTGAQNDSKALTEKYANDVAGSIAKQAHDTKSAFQNKAGDLYKEAQDKAAAANAQSLADRTAGTLRDPTTGQVVQPSEGQKVKQGGWEDGTAPATAENFWNASGLSNIGNVLGDANLAATKAGPAYVSGRNTTEKTNAGTLDVKGVPGETATLDDLPKHNEPLSNAETAETASWDPAKKQQYFGLTKSGVSPREAYNQVTGKADSTAAEHRALGRDMVNKGKSEVNPAPLTPQQLAAVQEEKRKHPNYTMEELMKAMGL